MQLVGVYYEEGPPVPIPNTVVKLFSAEDTWRAAARENRSTLTFKASCFRKVLFSFARLSAVSLRTNGFMLTTPRDTQGGALNFVRIMNYTPKFRPLLSSFCSLYLPPAALANEPWRAAARENRSTLTS